MANNFEYKIHVSIDQTGLQNDVKKALSDMAKEVKNNAYKIEFNGDYSSLIKQLVDLQKQIPNIDLTKGLEFHLSDKIREDSELGKTLIKELSTHVVNSMKEMMTSVDGIKKSISESSQLLDKLKSRRKELYDDKSITNATEAYEAAEKRFIEASSKLEKAGQDKTRVAAIDEMKKSYQDMINLEKEANKEASKSQTITNMGIMAEQADQEYKIAKDKYIKLSEIRKELLETKPTHNSYAEMLGDIDSQILSTENRLTELKKNLETAEHPELQIHGKLADDFLTDLQSQLDNLQGLEVKVTPKVDKENIKLEAIVDTKIGNASNTLNLYEGNNGQLSFIKEDVEAKREDIEVTNELRDAEQKLVTDIPGQMSLDDFADQAKSAVQREAEAVKRSQEEIRADIERTNYIIKVQKDWLKEVAIIDNDFKTSSKSEANAQLRSATNRLTQYRLHPERFYGDGTLDEDQINVRWYRARQEAIRQGSASSVIHQNDTDISEYNYNKSLNNLIEHRNRASEILAEAEADLKKYEAELQQVMSTVPNTSGQDKAQEELKQTGESATEAAEAIKREKEAESKPVNLQNQSLQEQLEFYKEFKKVVQEYWDLQGKASDPEYEFSEAESKRLDKITPKYEELIKIINQYSTAKANLKNGEVYDFIGGDPSDWTARVTQIKNFVFELRDLQKEQNIKNAYGTSREVDDWIFNNVNRQMYPPVVDYVSSEEEIQRAINKITEYKTKLEEISKSDYFGELSANMQSEIQNTITYLGNLITTEEKVLETSRRMTETTTGDINTQQTESHTEKLEQEAEAARDATDAINEKNNAEQQTNNTPTTTTSQLEREYEAREKNVIAINEQAEAERALRESSIVPTTVDGSEAIVSWVENMEETKAQAQEASDAATHYEDTGNALELLASELEKVNEITSSSTPNPKLDSIQQDIQEDIQEAEKLSDALGNITTDFNGAPVDVNRRTVYGKDKEGNEVQASMYSVRGEGFTATLNEEAEVVEMNTQILHGYTQAQNEATAAREDATRVGKSLNQMETESANEVSKAYQKLISDQEKYEASLKKTASAEAKQNWKDTQKEYYANLTKQVKEYIALKEKIASGNGIDEDKQKVDELENTWMQLVDTITNNGFFNKGMESKALSGIDGLESRLSQISTDVLTKNIAKLAEYQAAKEKALGQGYSENETYIQYLDSEINKLEEVNAKLRSNISTTEQETAVKNAEAEAEAKVAKQKEANAIAAQKVSDAGKKENQVLDKTRAQLLNQASALTTNGKLMEAYGDKVRAFLQEIQNTGTTKERLEQIRIELTKISSEATLAGKSGKTLGQILSGRAKSLVAYLSTFASFYRIVSYVRTAISTIKELDTQLVDLRKTTTMTTSELNEFYKSSSNVAKQMGVTTSEIISQASAWSRLGYSSKEASTEMAKLSSQFTSISPGMDTNSATDALVSTMQAYGIKVDEVQRKIMDNVNAIGNSMATTNQEIGDMLQRSSAAMKAANNTLEETIALESAAVEITRNAETTGTAFRTISMRIRGKQSLPPYSESYMLCA